MTYIIAKELYYVVTTAMHLSYIQLLALLMVLHTRFFLCNSSHKVICLPMVIGQSLHLYVGDGPMQNISFN
jgi:hypothetical protein